jgi:DNA-binding winged helix-turn-helix (wHTH) protein
LVVKARFGPFVLDSDSRQITHDSSGVVHLTPKAFDLLALLVAEAPRVVRKTELHERLWPGSFVSDATLVGLVKELRRALDDRDTSAPLIRTAHGFGYAFSGALQNVASHQRSSVSRWIVTGTRRILLSEGENLIGRDPASTVWLDTSGVSRRHARVMVAQGEALLEDLASKNGTCLDDKPVVGKVKLHDGDHIQIGPIFVVYHASESGMSTETLSPVARDR